MNRNNKDMFPDLKSAVEFFSSSGADVWTQWVMNCRKLVDDFLDKPEPRLPPRRSSVYKQHMPCYKSVSALIGRVDNLSLAFPELRESAEKMETQLRRFFEVVCGYVETEDACKGEGDLEALNNATFRLRDAGDDFAASILHYEVNKKSVEGCQSLNGGADSFGDDARMVDLYDDIVLKLWDSTSLIKRSNITIPTAIGEVLHEKPKYCVWYVKENGKRTEDNKIEALKKKINRWIIGPFASSIKWVDEQGQKRKGLPSMSKSYGYFIWKVKKLQRGH